MYLSDQSHTTSPPPWNLEEDRLHNTQEAKHKHTIHTERTKYQTHTESEETGNLPFVGSSLATQLVAADGFTGFFLYPFTCILMEAGS